MIKKTVYNLFHVRVLIILTGAKVISEYIFLSGLNKICFKKGDQMTQGPTNSSTYQLEYVFGRLKYISGQVEHHSIFGTSPVWHSYTNNQLLTSDL